MRILYISNPGSEKRIYGSHRALLNLIKGISEDSNNTLAVVFPEKGIMSDELEKDKIKCYFLNKYKLTTSPSLKLNIHLKDRLLNFFIMICQRFKSHKKLERIINEYNPDIVHTNVGPLDIAHSICTKRNIPHVWHLREYQDLDFNMSFFPSRKKFYTKIHSNNNHIIAITKNIFDHFELDTKKDRVIYDGVFNKPSILKVKKKANETFLFVGRICNGKGFDILIQSYIIYVQNGGTTELQIAGTSASKKYMEKYTNILKTNNINNRITFLGFRTDIYKLMQQAKALIVASKFEGFGFITTEAMYNKCLVIGKNTAGTKEQFDNGLELVNREIALRFNTKEELTQCLFEADSFHNEQMIDDAFKVVNKLYTIQTHCEQVISFYNDILSGNQKF